MIFKNEIECKFFNNWEKIYKSLFNNWFIKYYFNSIILSLS